MPLPSAISQAKTSNAFWILSLLIVGCGHDPSLEMDVPVAESSDSITDTLGSVSDDSNTNHDLSARLTKLEDAQRNLSINLVRVNEQLRRMTNALEAISGEEVVRQSSQTSSGVDTLLTPPVSTLTEMRDLLVTAYTSRDPELLYSLYPQRFQYEFIFGTRKQLVADRLDQIELERAYSAFFDDLAKLETNAVDDMIEILLPIGPTGLTFLKNADKVDLFVHKIVGESWLTDLSEEQPRIRAETIQENTFRGLFTGISSTSDVILENIGFGSLTFQKDHMIASIDMVILKLDGQWCVAELRTDQSRIWDGDFQAHVDDGDLELISDNSTRFDTIYTAIEDGTAVLVSVREQVEITPTLDSTNSTGP